jgi:hypothetical protein
MGLGGVDTNLLGVVPVCQFCQFSAKTGKLGLRAEGWVKRIRTQQDFISEKEHGALKEIVKTCT